MAHLNLRREIVLSLVLGVSVLLLVACGDDSDEVAPTEQTTTATSTSQPREPLGTAAPKSQPTQAAPTPTTANGLTGIETVDDLIEAIRAGNSDALVDAAVIQDFECEALPPSLCEPPPADGNVPVLPGGICDDNPIVDEGDAVRTALTDFLSRLADSNVLAAWYAEPGSDGPPQSVPEGSVRVLWASGPSLVVGSAGGIWYVYYGCGPATEALPETGADFIIAPSS